TIRLERSSFLLDANSALLGDSFAAAEGPGVLIKAGYCVFAQAADPVVLPIFPPQPNRRPVLVRAAEMPTQAVRFEGQQRKAYYRFDPLAVASGEAARYLTFDDCKAAKLPIEDRDAVTPDQRPWAEPDPLAMLAGPYPWRGFRLRLADPAVFTKDAAGVVGGQCPYSPTFPQRGAHTRRPAVVPT